MNDYYMSLGFDDDQFSFPVLPESITISEGGGNKTYNLLSKGEINVSGDTRLRTLNIKSFFPANEAPYTMKSSIIAPNDYVDRIRGWRSSGKPLRFIYSGLELFKTEEGNFQVLIEDFKITEKAGEVGDIYFELSLKEYRPYSAAIKQNVAIDEETVVASEVNERETEKAVPKTYTVVAGDNLWRIAKQLLGDGTRYVAIADLNDIENPDLIFPGQELMIPEK